MLSTIVILFVHICNPNFNICTCPKPSKINIFYGSANVTYFVIYYYNAYETFKNTEVVVVFSMIPTKKYPKLILLKAKVITI